MAALQPVLRHLEADSHVMMFYALRNAQWKGGRVGCMLRADTALHLHSGSCPRLIWLPQLLGGRLSTSSLQDSSNIVVFMSLGLQCALMQHIVQCGTGCNAC